MREIQQQSTNITAFVIEESLPIRTFGIDIKNLWWYDLKICIANKCLCHCNLNSAIWVLVAQCNAVQPTEVLIVSDGLFPIWNSDTFSVILLFASCYTTKIFLLTQWAWSVRTRPWSSCHRKFTCLLTFLYGAQSQTCLTCTKY